MPLPGPSVGVAASQKEWDEVDLVRRAQLGSTAAFERLVLARGPQLHRYLAIRLHDDADARDALQETLTAAWQGLPALKQAASFWPWLCGIAANKAADAVRERVRTTGAERRIDEPAADDLVHIREALNALPDRFREVLLLRYLLGLSEEETAEALGIRVGTVKSRTARARKALRESWR